MLNAPKIYEFPNMIIIKLSVIFLKIVWNFQKLANCIDKFYIKFCTKLCTKDVLYIVRDCFNFFKVKA